MVAVHTTKKPASKGTLATSAAMIAMPNATVAPLDALIAVSLRA